jgi:hypothetical protein
MVNSNLEYLADCIIIEALAKDDLSIKIFAQEGGAMASVADGIKSYVHSLWDPEKPIASVMAFLGRGMLWSMGFKWLSILYTVAEALGFDWIGFWDSVKNGITKFVKEMLPKGKIPQDLMSSKVNSVVANAMSQHSTGDVDQEKLKDLATGKVKLSFEQRLQEALEVKAIALQLEKNPKLIKSAGVLSLFKGKLSRFLISMISWVIKTGLISTGLVATAGAVSGLVGLHKDAPSGEETPKEDLGKQPIYKLPLSPNAPQELFAEHHNDINAVWLERGSIGEIENIIMSWVLNVYPQFQKYEEDLQNSSGFQSVVGKFRNRNRLATGLGFFSVPRPYMRKIDIVSEIVNGFMKERNISAPKSNPQTGREDESVAYK